MELTLTSKDDAIDQFLHSDPPLNVHFGVKPDLEAQKIIIRIGDTPQVENLRGLAAQKLGEIPREFQIFITHNIWIIQPTISLINEGSSTVSNLNVEIKFPKQPSTIVCMAPISEFISTLKIDNETKFKFDARLEAGGQISTPKIGIDTGLPAKASVKAGADGGITTTHHTEIIKSYSFETQTPKILSVGLGNNYGYWAFERDARSLLGDHPLILTVLIPEHLETIEFEICVSVTVKVLGIYPRTRKSPWVKFEANLPQLAGFASRADID